MWYNAFTLLEQSNLKINADHKSQITEIQPCMYENILLQKQRTFGYYVA